MRQKRKVKIENAGGKAAPENEQRREIKENRNNREESNFEK